MRARLQAGERLLGVFVDSGSVVATEVVAGAGFDSFSVDLIYFQMQMMAIGFMMAGPDLNPTNFEKGMFSYEARLGREYLLPLLARSGVDLAGKGVLDVGCGYGGVLAALGLRLALDR